MIEALAEKLERKMNISEESHYMGALGAAMFAMDSAMAGEERAIKKEVA